MPDAQPNYLTTDPQGNVGANFSGHVSAAGVDFVAKPFFSLPESQVQRQSITWYQDTLNGAQVARVVASSDAELSMYAAGPPSFTTGGPITRLDLWSNYNVNDRRNSVTATVDNQVINVLRGDGESDFSIRECWEYNTTADVSIGANQAASLGNFNILFKGTPWFALLESFGENSASAGMPFGYAVNLDGNQIAFSGYAFVNGVGYRGSYKWSCAMQPAISGTHSVAGFVAASNNPGLLINRGMMGMRVYLCVR